MPLLKQWTVDVESQDAEQPASQKAKVTRRVVKPWNIVEVVGKGVFFWYAASFFYFVQFFHVLQLYFK